MKFLVISLLVIVLGVLDIQARASDNKSSERIYGGALVQNDDPKKQSFTVRLVYTDAAGASTTGCSGAIVTQSWIVTVANCLATVNLATGVVNVRITGLLGTLFQTIITQITIHPDYNAGTLANNIAVAKVRDPFTSTNEIIPYVQGNPTWDKTTFVGIGLELSGYRDVYTIDDYYIEEPTWSKFIPKSDSRCASFNLVLNPNEFCAESTDYTKIGACQYDFGAVLYRIGNPAVPTDKNFYSYAIASRTAPNTCTTGPTVFIPLNIYYTWIASATV